MSRGLLAAATAVASITALLGACGDTTAPGVTELNLDRPVDVSFACYGKMRQTNGRPGMGMASDPIIKTAMPSTICQALSPSLSTDPITPTPGQETLNDANGKPLPDNPGPTWYGFILQSASGTVALTTWPAVPADSISPQGFPQQISDTVTSLFQVLDADPLTPGKNALSVGEDPVAIGTDKSGCFEITANAGSCDLSQLDITSALSNIVDHSEVRPRIDRVPVVALDGTKNQDGTPHVRKILSKPSAMIVEPFRNDLDADTVGKVCPANAASKLYITYPSCHLVAEVEFGLGQDGRAVANVIGGIHFDDHGTPSVLAGQALADAVLSCPTECAPDRGMTPVPVTDGYRPVALDYRLDPNTDGVKLNITSRLAIGADIRRAMPTAAGPPPPLTMVDLDLMTFEPLSAKLLSIPLEGNGGPVGVSALALSPQIGMGGDASNGNMPVVNEETNTQAQYVYAVATDGTVRVADVLTRNRECDTQIDARFLRNVALLPDTRGPQDPSLDCLPRGRPDLPRRPGARSPGIELPDGAVANSVAIVKGLSTAPPYSYTPPGSGSGSNSISTPMPPQPGLLLGHFAVITASSGAIYVANVDDDYVPDTFNPAPGHSLGTSPALVMAHQLRDSMSRRDAPPGDCTNPDPPAKPPNADPTANDPGGAGEGGPRLTAPPGQQFVARTLFDDLDHQLPRLQQVACDVEMKADPSGMKPLVPVSVLAFGAPEIGSSPAGPAVSRNAGFPDLQSVVNENWTLTYEGTLARDSTVTGVNGPELHVGQTFVDPTGMFIEDASQPFCHMGVEPGDVVEFRGCDPTKGDTDCPSGYTCFVHPASLVSNLGACFLKTEAPRLQDACRNFLSTVRRYTVGTDANGGTAPGKLVLWQRKHELSTTPIDGCMSDAQCDDLAQAALVINQSADPFLGPNKDGKAQTQWRCLADPLRKAINADPARNKRCVQVCDPTPPEPNKSPAPVCASGTVCLANDPKDLTKGGVCMEGIEPPQACLNGPQRYVVDAAEAFTVVGDHTGFVHPIVTSTDGSRCVRDPNLAKDPLSIGRIPLTAPPCDPGADPVTGLIGNSTQFEANPCSLTVQQFDYRWGYPMPSDGAYGSCRNPIQVQQDPTKAPAPELTDVPAIKFRNRSMTLTLVEPYREAGQSCLQRQPANVPTNIPLVVPGYQIAFTVKGGYAPLTLSVGPQVSPVKVVRGPSESIWIIDDGDFLGDGVTQATTRGRVFRVESVPAPQPAPPGPGNPSVQLIINTLE